MKRRPIDKNSAGVPAVLEIIRAHPGIGSEQIALRACYSISHTKNVLGVLSGQGLAFPVPEGTRRGWFVAELAKPLLEQWDRTRRKRAKPGAVRPTTKRERIEAMSMAPNGVSAAEIMATLGLQLNAVGKHCGELARQGRVYRADRKGCRVRWFETAERAAGWIALGPMIPSEWVEPGKKSWRESRDAQKAAKAKRDAIREKKFAERQKAAEAKREAAIRAQKMKADRQRKPVNVSKFLAIKPEFSVAAPVTLKPQALAQEVDYSRAKVTICPSPKYNYRHEYAPGSDAHTGFVRDWQQRRSAA